jgi:uncharacterized membrane protein
MSTFKETIAINAAADTVWPVLADIGNIADWNAGLVSSRATNSKTGLGATRHCVISDAQSLDEEVTHFKPKRAITFRIVQSTMPFQSADIRFTLSSDAHGTTVTVSPLYTLKYGMFGRLLDRLVVKRVYRKGKKGLLSGLKDHAEAQVRKEA